MDSQVKILIDRSDNELFLTSRIKMLTEDVKIKEMLAIPKNKTFYSSVISHAYYAIFYSAKAMLLSKGIKTSSPDIRKQTF